MNNKDIQSRDIYDSNDSRNVIFQAKPRLYTCLILPMWLILSISLGLITYYYGMVPDYNLGHPYMGDITWIVLILNVIYFFMVCQNIMYAVRYGMVRKKDRKVERRTLALPFPTSRDWQMILRTKHRNPKVTLIYCTYNDFLPDCLYQCMFQQTYPVDVKILDDSDKPKYKQEVNLFASKHSNHVQVIRRTKHKNDKNKAGNLNHGLKVIKNQHYDFYIFLDSDELLEPKFTEKMLKMFYYGDKYGYHIGLIQANHLSGRNVNKFMTMNKFSALFFWPVQNVVRSVEAGIRIPVGNNHRQFIAKKGDTVCSNLGHGCMADANALYISGLFPNEVSEDVASTMSMINYGYNTYFASQIYGNEETVTDMNAMKIRCNKFANGDLQWCRNYFKPIVHTNMESHLQKIDTINLMGSTNISGFLYCSLLFYNIWYPAENAQIGTSIIFLIPIILFLYSSGIIDTILSLNHMSIWSTIVRELEVLATFSSTYYIAVKATYGQLILHHKAKFKVTPKDVEYIHWYQAITDNISEIIFSLFTIIISFWFGGWTAWMVLLAFVPPLFSPLAELMVNNQSETQKKLQKVLQLHRRQALISMNVHMDSVWDNWKI